jgi:hypothetical protein
MIGAEEDSGHCIMKNFVTYTGLLILQEDNALDKHTGLLKHSFRAELGKHLGQLPLGRLRKESEHNIYLN